MRLTLRIGVGGLLTTALIAGIFLSVRVGHKEGCDPRHAVERIIAAREAINDMQDQAPEALAGQRHEGYALAASILRQRTFGGVLGENGAIVSFDDHGEPSSAITLRKHDFCTDTQREQRPYTASELAAHRNDFKEELRRTGPAPAIPVFSRSMQLAVAMVVLSESHDQLFRIGRGSRSNADALQVASHSLEGVRVIAADALYTTGDSVDE